MAKVISTPKYQATDGQVFDNELDCDRHDIALTVDADGQFTKFTATSGYNSRVKAVIVAWEQFKAGKLEQFTPPTPRAPKATETISRPPPPTEQPPQ